MRIQGVFVTVLCGVLRRHLLDQHRPTRVETGRHLPQLLGGPGTGAPSRTRGLVTGPSPDRTLIFTQVGRGGVRPSPLWGCRVIRGH